MKIAVYTHKECLEHDTGPGHPENRGRLEAILYALGASDFIKDIEVIEAPLGRADDILRAHSQNYFESVGAASPESGMVYLDGDTVMSTGSYQAALRGAGAVCAAVDVVMEGKFKSAFCATRPPGHHATPERAMGFCLFNNIAIAALYALEKKDLSRVAIVDFDVHHGNGTQDIFEHDDRVLYISTHEYPLYPGTGAEDETGVGNLVNIPLRHGTDGDEYREIFTALVLPALERFQPEMVLVSAGFDAHRDDPLAGLNLTSDDFGWIGAQLHAFAQKNCNGRVLSILEGGYNHHALAESVMAYLRSFMD